MRGGAVEQKLSFLLLLPFSAGSMETGVSVLNPLDCRHTHDEPGVDDVDTRHLPPLLFSQQETMLS
jgi:hypothetical protein